MQGLLYEVQNHRHQRSGVSAGAHNLFHQLGGNLFRRDIRHGGVQHRAQQLQVAKANLQKETPVCTVLQPPSVPLKKSNASKLNILLICIFLGVAVAAVWVLWGRDTWASFKTGLKDSDE